MTPDCICLALWNGRVAPVLDVADSVRLLVVEEGRLVRSWERSLAPAMLLNVLRECNVHTLVCGAITRRLERDLEGQGVHVVPFVRGDVLELESSAIHGTLASYAFTLPGCRQRRLQCMGQECVENKKRGDYESRI